MTDDINDQGQDVFDDSDAGSGGAATDEASITTKEGAGVDLEEDNAEPASKGEEESSTGENNAEPPAADQDDPEVVVNDKGQKMIPEHRFKAALKKVTDELDQTNAKLKEYEKPPEVAAPDKDIDPEGHDLHIRMEASKSVMMEMKPDYQEVINHYATLAESNELLNQAVAKHPLPAKLAYDIAKRDLEIKEAMEVRNSDEWKEFQEFKKNKTTAAVTTTPEETTLGNKINRGLKAVPNLNRTTNASPNRNVRHASNGDNDDDLFRGAL
jgi:uncharacterized membrane-anchored protein YhcB (DUF1043 family)